MLFLQQTYGVSGKLGNVFIYGAQERLGRMEMYKIRHFEIVACFLLLWCLVKWAHLFILSKNKYVEEIKNISAQCFR